MAQRLIERHGHCNTCNCDFTFVKGLLVHDDHDIVVTKEYFKDVPDDLKGEVTDY